MPIYVTLCQKNIKALCNTLNWGNWDSGFGKLGVRWAERDISHNYDNSFLETT